MNSNGLWSYSEISLTNVNEGRELYFGNSMSMSATMAIVGAPDYYQNGGGWAYLYLTTNLWCRFLFLTLYHPIKNFGEYGCTVVRLPSSLLPLHTTARKETVSTSQWPFITPRELAHHFPLVPLANTRVMAAVNKIVWTLLWQRMYLLLDQNFDINQTNNNYTLHHQQLPLRLPLLIRWHPHGGCK